MAYPTTKDIEFLANRIIDLLPENDSLKFPPWVRDKLNEVIEHLEELGK